MSRNRINTTQFRAILDMINFPINVPGNLDVRLVRCTFTDDGQFIDQGNRATSAVGQTTGAHRFVVSADESATARLADQVGNGATALDGYELPSPALIEHIAAHEHEPARLERRRNALAHGGLRLNVRALGFDLLGEGQLAVGIGKVTIRGGRHDMTQKAGVTLYPGDPLENFLQAIDGFAMMIGYETISDDDKSLVRHVAAYLWNDHPQSDALPFAQRMRALGDWRSVPVGQPMPQTEKVFH